MKIDLLHLETLVNFTNLHKMDIPRLDCSYRAEYEPQKDESFIYYEWVVSARLPVVNGSLIARMPSLQASCIKLIEAMQAKDYKIPSATTLKIISNDSQLEKLFLRLQQLTIDKIGYALFITYWANSPDSRPYWSGSIMTNSRWASGWHVRIEASSLYEVCAQLIEPFQQLEPR